MGYGAGGILVVVGLVLALAVDVSVQGVDLVMVGWIMTIVGVLLLLLTAVTLNSARRGRTTATTVNPDGSQTVRETRTEI